MDIKNTFKELSNNRKIILAVILLCLVLVLSIIATTLANFMKEDASIVTSVWDGSIATDFKSGDGTKNNPFIISTGSELAYFGYTLEQNDYSDTYFSISNNIILNKGTLRYNPETGIEYILDNKIYYVEYYTNKYYLTPEKNGAEVGTINILRNFKNFKGNIEGNTNTIFGLYLTDSESETLGLFNNLTGSLNNLFFKNTLVYGGNKTAGLAVKTDDAIINNIIFDGFIVNKQGVMNNKKTGTVQTDPILLYNYPTTNYINIKEHIPLLTSKISTFNLSGTFTEDVTISINNTPVVDGKFYLEFDHIPESITVTGEAHENINFNLSLNYEINYEEAYASGLIHEAKNTVIKNSVNASNIFGNINSSGIVSIASGKLEIENSYNRGQVNSVSLSTGLIGEVNSADVINLVNSYNSGYLNSENCLGLIGNIFSDNIINIDKTLDLSGSLSVLPKANINITNSYTTNTENQDGFTSVTQDELTRELLTAINYLEFNEEDNIWYYPHNNIPLNYYDHKLTKVTRLNVGNLSFNEYKELSTPQIIKRNITFNLEEVNALDSVISKQYYISESTDLLNIQELDNIESWINYDSISTISTEGKYVIYIKTVDYKNNVTYINSEILILDLSSPQVLVSNELYSWNEYNEQPINLYSNKELKLTVEALDNLSGIAYIKYMSSENIYSESELDNLEETTWIDYDNEILINELGTSILYIKTVDNSENVSYINTSNITYQGYRAIESYAGITANNEQIHITNNSALTVKFKYNEKIEKIDNVNHYIVTSNPLPVGTNIKLFDNITKKIYSYNVEACEDCTGEIKYKFNLFTEVGKTGNSLYEGANYYNNGIYEEEYTIIVKLPTLTDYSSSDMKIYLETYDNDNKLIRSSIENTIPSINIYNEKSSLYFTSETDEQIDLNTNSVTNINISGGVNHKRNNEYKIIDTNYFYKYLTFNLSVQDSEGNIIPKNKLKNLVIKSGDNNYSFGSDNIARIPGNILLEETNKELTIITHEGNTDLEEGTYYLKIIGSSSLDGYIKTDIYQDIVIPVNVSRSNYNKTGIFNIETELNSLSKINSAEDISFKINQSGYFSNLKLSVSLYQKEELTGFNQKYKIVDLNNYISNSLTAIDNYNYIINVNNNEFNLNFKPNSFKNTGYQLVFEIYDGENKIDIIKKHFIVR